MRRLHVLPGGDTVGTDAILESRLFVIALDDAGGYTFLTGEQEFSVFVAERFDRFPEVQFARIDGILVSGKTTIGDTAYYSGFNQADEFQREQQSLFELAWALLAVYLLVFVMLLISSHFIFLPVEEMFRKQREFVQNASHELKTPITVIDANCCVLQSEVGETSGFKTFFKSQDAWGSLFRICWTWPGWIRRRNRRKRWTYPP